MGRSSSSGDSESRFAAYVEALGAALGHADRVIALRNDCAGLPLPGERKSIDTAGPPARRYQINSPLRNPSAGSGTHFRGRSERRIGATE